MNYNLIYDNPEESLLTRLFKVRHIDDDIERFLHPKISDYWIDPFLLNDMNKAVERIIEAMKQKEKIMIFWDYDVDGITSSYILYSFITDFLNYKNISIMYPNRLTDGYWLKIHHLDTIKNKGISLVITVDNWITSIEEAIYAKTLGIDIIITDHHKDLEKLPDAVAVVNPQVSLNYPFKWLAWVWVSFKLINALLTKSNFDANKKNDIFSYYLPLVAIGTVADVVPLVDENRMMVKKWLELMNRKRKNLPLSLQWFLNYLNLNEIDTFHIWFVIGPRINAWWRIDSPYDSLRALLYSWEKQIEYLDIITQRNDERKKMQEEHFKLAESIVHYDDAILIAAHEDFHEWVIGIVSGKLTEKYNKPSMVMRIDTEKWQWIASLRWPEYFDVIAMISKAGDILKRFWWHKQAWWLAVDLQYLEQLKTIFIEHCSSLVSPEVIEKSVKVDTKLYPHEWEHSTLSQIEKLAPFWEGNKEPIFLLEDIGVTKVEKIGTNGKSHMKIHGTLGNKNIVIMFWWKWAEVDNLIERVNEDDQIHVVGKIRKDTYNWWYYLEWLALQ